MPGARPNRAVPMSMEEVSLTEYSEPPPTGSISAIKKGTIRGYVVWNARSTRSEYWLWTLFVIIVAVAAQVVDGLLFSSVTASAPTSKVGPTRWNNRIPE